MRRRPPSDHELTEIEFVEGDLSDGFDVEFSSHHGDPGSVDSDPASHRRARSWWIAGGVLGVVGVLVAVTVLTSGGNEAEVATTTTSPRRQTTVPRTTPTTTQARPPTTEVAPTATFVPIVPSTFPPFVPTPSPISEEPLVTLPEATADLASFGSDGTTLYLWDTASGPAALVAMDTTTGALTPVDLGQVTGPLRAVVPADGGPIVDAGQLVHVTSTGPLPISPGDDEVTDFSRTGPRVAGGMTGPIWFRGLGAGFIARYDPSSRGVDEQYPLPLGMELIGTSADGRPIVRGPDLKALEIQEDGSAVAFAQGITTPVENGRYAEVRCGLGTECVVTIVGVTASTTFSYDVPDNLDRTSVRISPSGEFAAIAVDDDVRIVNTTTGEGVTVPFSYVPSSSDAADRPIANYFRLARDLVWNGSAPFLLMLTPDGIVMVRAVDGSPLARLVIDVNDPLRYVPMAIG